MIACLVTSNSKIKIQSSDSKNIKEITKVDRQIDKKVNEIQEIEDLLFRIEQYKAENNIR